MIRRPLPLALPLFLVAFLLSTSRARADVSLGDAVLTVAVSTVAGAALGASTLPFYEESGEHTNNIFYGAAIGAVAGVVIAAYAGVSEGPDYGGDEARAGTAGARPPAYLSLNEAPSFRLRSERSSALPRPAAFAAGARMAWAPVASVRF